MRRTFDLKPSLPISRASIDGVARPVVETNSRWSISVAGRELLSSSFSMALADNSRASSMYASFFS
ncbi:MAG: hypothetical protein IH914_00220 [candidate division Zixibacteria bacterium]|nr:hypothetical protein [candidate division Zixibacteria bacterium]